MNIITKKKLNYSFHTLFVISGTHLFVSVIDSCRHITDFIMSFLKEISKVIMIKYRRIDFFACQSTDTECVNLDWAMSVIF